MRRKPKYLLLVIIFILSTISLNVKAGTAPSLNATIFQTQGITIVPGNSTATYTLNISVLNFGTDVAANPNLTLFMPYGMLNNTAGTCNGPGGFYELNKTTVACNISIGGHILNRSSNSTQVVIKSLISSFQNYTSLPFTVNAFCTNCTAGINSTNTTFINTMPFWRNPRPRISLDYILSNTTNSTFLIDGWHQSRPIYEVWLPVFSFNQTSNRPEPANFSYGDIIYADKSFMENPTYMEMYSFSLNFTLIFNHTNSALGEENVTYVISAGGYNTTAQSLRPLLIQSFNYTDLNNQNITQIIAVPAPSGFTVYYNNSIFTDSSLLEIFGINITYIQVHGNILIDEPARSKFLEIRAPSTLGKYLNFSIKFTLLYAGSNSPNTISPIFVTNQIVGGFDPRNGDAPPRPGDNITMSYIADIKNTLANFTLDGIKIRFLTPINITTNSSSFNMSSNDQVSWYDVNIWNNTLNNGIIIRGLICNSFIDAIGGSTTSGDNITMCFNTYDFNLSAPQFNYWSSGYNTTNITVNSTATMSFPILEESDLTPDTPNSANIYNATISLSQAGKLNLTAEIPGLTLQDGITQVLVDGDPLSSGNYTHGSFLVNSLGQGTHTVSVSYTKASSAASSGSSSAGGGGGGAEIRKVFSIMNPGSPTSWNINDASIGLMSISINVKEKVSGVKIIINKNPPDYSKPSNLDVFRYFSISAPALENKIKDATINFEVKKEWISRNSVDQDKIFLLRYSNNQWQKLETKKIKTAQTSIEYQSTTPGFSIFVIGGEKTLVNNLLPKPKVTGSQIQDIKKSPSDNQESSRKTNLTSLIIIILGLIIIIGYFVYQRKQHFKWKS